MSGDPHSRGGPPTYLQPGAVWPSHAERVRTLMAERGDGMLSTLALDPAGHPFGSVITFALDDGGAPLMSLSTMAEHTRNLQADPRASLLVTATGEGAGRLAVARATLVGTVRPVTEEEQEHAVERYLSAHPDAFWARFGDFSVHRLTIEAIRYVRGFGEMSWIEPAAYASASPDPLAPSEARIVRHMNDDHTDAMRAMVAAFLQVADPVAAVSMLSCDRYGVELRLSTGTSGDGVAFGRIGFERPLRSAAEARQAMVDLTRRARSLLSS